MAAAAPSKHHCCAVKNRTLMTFPLAQFVLVLAQACASAL